MRPSLLDPYFAPVTRLAGIGPKLAPLFDTLVGRAPEPARLVDLLVDDELRGRVAAAGLAHSSTFDAPTTIGRWLDLLDGERRP